MSLLEHLMNTNDLRLALLRQLDDPRDVVRLCLASHGTKEGCRLYLTDNKQAGKQLLYTALRVCADNYKLESGCFGTDNWLEHWEACRSAVAWILDMCGKEALLQHSPVMKLANAALSPSVAIAPKLSAMAAKYFVTAGYRVQYSEVVLAAKQGDRGIVYWIDAQNSLGAASSSQNREGMEGNWSLLSAIAVAPKDRATDAKALAAHFQSPAVTTAGPDLVAGLLAVALSSSGYAGWPPVHFRRYEINGTLMDYFLSLPALQEVESDVINSLFCAAIKADSALALHGLHRLAGARRVPGNIQQLEALLNAMEQAPTLNHQHFYTKDLLWPPEIKITPILREASADRIAIGKIQQALQRLLVRATESTCSECIMYCLCVVIEESRSIIQIAERFVEALQDVVVTSRKASWLMPPPAFVAQQRRNMSYGIMALLPAPAAVRKVFTDEVDYIDECCFKVSHLERIRPRRVV